MAPERQETLTREQQTAGRRLSTITVDQVLSGGSNLLVAVLAAHALTVAHFGLFGIAFLIFVLAQAITRALVCEPLLIHPEESETRSGDVIGTASVLGVAVGLMVAGSGLIARWWHADLGTALLVLAACMPLLVLHDLGRYLGFARHRPGDALALDVTWLLLLIASAGLVIASDNPSIVTFLMAWAGSGALAGLLTLWQHRGRSLRPHLGWLRETWTLAWRYLVSNFFNQGSALAASLIVAGLANAVALGALRGAQLLTRPFMTFYIAATAAGVAELSRAVPRTSDYSRHVRRTTVLTTGVALVNMGLLLAVPDALGRIAIGDTWQAAKPLLLPAGVQIVFIGMLSGVRAGLLGMRAIRTVMWLDVTTNVSILLLTTGGLLVGDVVTAYWALAIGQGVITAGFWIAYARQEPAALAVPTERAASAAAD